MAIRVRRSLVLALMMAVVVVAACGNDEPASPQGEAGEGGEAAGSAGASGAASGGAPGGASGRAGGGTSGGSAGRGNATGGTSGASGRATAGASGAGSSGTSAGASSGATGDAGEGASSGGTDNGGTGNGGMSGGAGETSGDDPCDDPGLVWRSANKTNYTSYPDPGSEECIEFNGCTWAGQFAACDGKKPEAWVAAHNIVAAFPDFESLALHDLCLRRGSETLVVTVLDTCGDSDCNGCCTENQGSAEQLIDLESYTNERWGVPDGPIEWADLGETTGGGCE